ncbi:MAG: hypothetical protein ABI645_17455 [Pseudomonadota bacterium]
MKLTIFRYCMLIGALALGSLAIFYFVEFIELSFALSNNGTKLELQQSIRALWLAFACQALLIGALYALVAWKPHAVSREVIVILGLLQLVEAVLQFSFAGSGIVAGLLIVAALFVLIGSVLWPKRLPPTSTATFTGLVK